MIALGVNPSFVEDTSGFHAGTRGCTDDSREFVYQRAGEAIGQHDAVEVDMAAGQAWQLSASRTSGESGNPVGVAHEALAEGEFGWFQVWGTATVRTVQETLAEGAELWPGSVAGALDHTQGARPVDGLFVSGGQNNLATVSLTYPRIAAQTSTGTGASNVPDKPATPSQDTQYNLSVTAGGVASWVEDDGSMAVDQTARDAAATADDKADRALIAAATADADAATADAKAVSAQATADSKSNVPNVPAASVADADYNLRVATDGTATWEVDDGGSGTGGPITDDQIPDDITRDSELQATAQALEGEIVDSLSLDRWKGFWRFPHRWADNDEVAYTRSDNAIGLYRRRAGQAGEDRTQQDNPEANSTGEASPWIALSGRGELNAQLHWLASGMSKGGETNQFLKKTSGRDFETEWATILGLPPYPSSGDRDDKIPKFDGDVLGWETDAGASGSTATPPTLLHTFTWTDSTSTLAETNASFADHDYLILEGWVGTDTSSSRDSGYGAFKRTDLAVQSYEIEFANNNRLLIDYRTSDHRLRIRGLSSAEDTGEIRVWGAAHPIGGGDKGDKGDRGLNGGGYTAFHVKIADYDAVKTTDEGDMIWMELPNVQTSNITLKLPSLGQGDASWHCGVYKFSDANHYGTVTVTDHSGTVLSKLHNQGEFQGWTWGGAYWHMTSQSGEPDSTPLRVSAPQWSTLSGTIRKGTIVEHNGFPFLAKQDHEKGGDEGNGPDGDPVNWWDLDSWWGVVSQQAYYPEGAMGKTGAGTTLKIWMASEFILDTDPLPTDSNNTKWKQIWPSSQHEPALRQGIESFLGDATLRVVEELGKTIVINPEDTTKKVITLPPVLVANSGAMQRFIIQTGAGETADIRVPNSGSIIEQDGTAVTKLEFSDAHNGHVIDLEVIGADQWRVVNRFPESATAPVVSERTFSTKLADVTNFTSTSFVKMEFDADNDVELNVGDYTIANSVVTVPTAGRYVCIGAIDGTASGASSNNRARIYARFAHTTSGTTTGRETVGRSYARNQYPGFFALTAPVSDIIDCQAGDSIELQGLVVEQTSTDTMAIDGSASKFAIYRIGTGANGGTGPKGDKGDPGLDGGRLAFEQIDQDTDHDYVAQLTPTSIDMPTEDGLYGIQFTENDHIHLFTLAALKAKAANATGTDAATNANSLTFGDYHLGRSENPAAKIDVGWQVQANQVVTLYRVGAGLTQATLHNLNALPDVDDYTEGALVVVGDILHELKDTDGVKSWEVFLFGAETGRYRVSGDMKAKDFIPYDAQVHGSDISYAALTRTGTLAARAAVLYAGTVEAGAFYGGRANLSSFSDLHTWERTSAGITITKPTINDDDRDGVTAPLKPARLGSGAMAANADLTRLLMFGGEEYRDSSHERDVNDVWGLELQNNGSYTARKFTQSGDVPGAWTSPIHVGTTDQGILGFGVDNEPTPAWPAAMRQYAVNWSAHTITWTLMRQVGTVPHGRTAAVAGGHFVPTDNPDLVIIEGFFGLGYGGSALRSDWARYHANLTTGIITYETLTPTGDVPSARTLGAADGDGSSGLIIGGAANNATLNDAHRYLVNGDTIDFESLNFTSGIGGRDDLLLVGDEREGLVGLGSTAAALVNNNPVATFHAYSVSSSTWENKRTDLSGLARVLANESAFDPLRNPAPTKDLIGSVTPSGNTLAGHSWTIPSAHQALISSVDRAGASSGTDWLQIPMVDYMRHDLGYDGVVIESERNGAVRNPLTSVKIPFTAFKRATSTAPFGAGLFKNADADNQHIDAVCEQAGSRLRIRLHVGSPDNGTTLKVYLAS